MTNELSKVYQVFILRSDNLNYRLESVGDDPHVGKSHAEDWIKKKGQSGIDYVVMEIIHKQEAFSNDL